MEEAVKKVRVDYTVADHAAGPLGRIAKEAEHAGHAVGHLKERVKEFRGETAAMAAGILGVGFGLGAWVEKAKEANKEFGGAQKQIASTLATILDWPKAMEPVERFRHSMKLSKETTRELDETAARFGMGLTDLADAYKTIGVSAAPMHLTQKQWMDLAIKSAAAAKQFGISGAEAADTIGKALVSKSIRPASDLGKFLKNEVGGNLKKLNDAQILERMDKALNQSVGIADQLGKGVGGAIARIQNRVDDLFRDLTGPLFGRFASVLDDVAGRLGRLGEDGRPVIETYANKLVSAFEVMKEATTFILDHWKQIAAVWAGMKVAGGIAGAANSIASGAAASGAKGLVGRIGSVAKGAGIPLIGASIGMAADAYLERRAGRQEDLEKLGSLRGIYSDLAQIEEAKAKVRGFPAGWGGSPQGAREIAEVNKGVVDRMQSIADQFQKMGVSDTEAFKAFRGVGGAAANLDDKDVAGALGVERGSIGRLTDLLNKVVFEKGILSWSSAKEEEDADALRKTTGRAQVIFTGKNEWNLKFEEYDPDRFMLRFQDDVENYVGRRTSSALANPFED